MKNIIFLNKVRSIRFHPDGTIVVFYETATSWTTILPGEEWTLMGGATPSITETDALLTKWRSEVETESD